MKISDNESVSWQFLVGRWSVIALALWLLSGLTAPSSAVAQEGDVVEFLSGRKVVGKILRIRKDQKEFDFQYQISGRDFTRTYKFGAVHAVTMKGKRYVLTKPSVSPNGGSRSGSVRKSRADIKRMIAETGASLPDWYQDAPTNYPKSLDLSWPIKPPTKGWKNQVNIGQYIWDIINPNPGRWRSGIKLVHQCMSRHAGNQELLTRDRRTLGRMYFTLLQDYPRAAYWLEKGGADMSGNHGAMLAECYWRMGSREMAEEMLRARALPLGAVKLLGDLGEVDRAVRLAKAFGSSRAKNQALMLAADALRSAGRTREAVTFYQQIVNAKDFRNKDYEARSKGRARDSIAAIQLASKADVKRVSPGDYAGSAVGYNGRIEVAVSVGDGKINSVKVTRHNEKQFYSAINDTTAQIMKTQGVKNIDATSGATITSQAIVNATAKALASGVN